MQDNTTMSVPKPTLFILERIVRSASIAYESGSKRATIPKIPAPESGKIAPERKNNGITRKFIIN